MYLRPESRQHHNICSPHQRKLPPKKNIIWVDRQSPDNVKGQDLPHLQLYPPRPAVATSAASGASSSSSRLLFFYFCIASHHISSSF